MCRPGHRPGPVAFCRYVRGVVNRRAELRRQYLSLGTGELAAATLFAAVAALGVVPLIDGDRARAALWAALVPLLAVLVQAGAYWLLARRWVGLGSMPPRLAALYRVLRVADVVLLALGLAGVAIWLPATPGAALMVIGVWLFGVVEYLNYFVVRLSYPIGRWATAVREWRTPRLAQDLRTR